MFIVFGSGRKIEDWQYIGRRFCQTCEGFTNYYISREVSYSSIFFIPIFKIPKAYYIRCNCCERGFEITKEQAMDLRKQFEHLPGKEQISHMLEKLTNMAKEAQLDDGAKDELMHYAKKNYGIAENEEYVSRLIDDMLQVERIRLENHVQETN